MYQYEEKAKKETTIEQKKALMSILSSYKALGLVIASLASFAVTAYFLIRLSTIELIYDQGYALPPITINIGYLYYIAILFSALAPIFLVCVYFYAKKKNWQKSGRFFHFARIYYTLAIIIIVLLGIFGFILGLSLLVRAFLLAMLYIIILIISVVLSVWMLGIIESFLTQMRNNLLNYPTAQLADPKKVIVISWIVIGLRVLSLILGLIGIGEYTSDVLPLTFVLTLNQASIYMSIISLLIPLLLLAVLYDIKTKFTNQSFEHTDSLE